MLYKDDIYINSYYVKRMVKFMIEKLKRFISRHKKVVAGSSALIIGLSAVFVSAYFTDYESKTITAKAGTVEIQLTDHSQIDSDNDTILNPGDTGTLAYTIENIGSKSIDAKTLIAITSDNVLNQADPEYTLSGDGITKAPTFSEDGKTINYEVDSVVINGTIETEPEAEGTSADQSFVFTFDIDSKNAFQDDNVVINYTVYAKQHRNTTESDWSELIDAVIGDPDEGEEDGDETEPSVPEGYAINDTNFPDSVIMADATTIDSTLGNNDGYITEDEKQETYTPSASVQTSFKGADKLSDTLVITNQEDTLTVNDAADITEVIANDMDLNEVVVDDLTNLEVLEVKNNNISEISLSNNTNLTTLAVNGNSNLTSLDLSQNANIQTLSLGTDTSISAIGLPTNDSLDVKTLLNDFVSNDDYEWFYSCNSESPIDLASDDIYKANGNTIYKQNAVIYPIAIDDTNFPNEDFRNYVMENFDNNADNYLSESEVRNATTITLSDTGINDFTGIEYFKNLEYFYCEGNDITSLDVSQNRNLVYLDCGENELTELNLNTNCKLETLYCNMNQIKNLDLSYNRNLIEVDCSSNNMEKLNINNCDKLEELRCYANDLTYLDLSDNIALKQLDCYTNMLTELDTTNNTNLEKLTCNDNQITNLNLSNNTKLSNLSCNDNDLEELNLENNNELSILVCKDTGLNKITLPNNNETFKFTNLSYGNYTQWKTEDGMDLSSNNIIATGQTIVRK